MEPHAWYGVNTTRPGHMLCEQVDPPEEVHWGPTLHESSSPALLCVFRTSLANVQLFTERSQQQQLCLDVEQGKEASPGHAHGHLSHWTWTSTHLHHH